MKIKYKFLSGLFVSILLVKSLLTLADSKSFLHSHIIKCQKKDSIIYLIEQSSLIFIKNQKEGLNTKRGKKINSLKQLELKVRWKSNILTANHKTFIGTRISYLDFLRYTLKIDIEHSKLYYLCEIDYTGEVNVSYNIIFLPMSSNVVKMLSCVYKYGKWTYEAEKQIWFDDVNEFFSGLDGSKMDCEQKISNINFFCMTKIDNGHAESKLYYSPCADTYKQFQSRLLLDK